MDNKRIRDLEREVANLREQLAKERAETFYKLTKDDFMSLVDTYNSDVAESKVTTEQKEALWIIWRNEFDKRFSSSNVYDDMMLVMKDIIKEQTVGQ
jgi:hypothetical protein